MSQEWFVFFRVISSAWVSVPSESPQVSAVPQGPKQERLPGRAAGKADPPVRPLAAFAEECAPTGARGAGLRAKRTSP